MQLATCLFLVLGVGFVADPPVYPLKARAAAVLATVRVVNTTQDAEGTGVILGRKGAFVYVLTAAHVVKKAEGLEVATFSMQSYPKPSKVYRMPKVLHQTTDVRDLAILRLTTDDPLPGTLTVCPDRSVPAAKGFKALGVGCDKDGTPTVQLEDVEGKKTVRRKDAAGEALFWEVKTKQAPGRSGGPLISGDGYLIGVCSGVSGERSYYTHVEEIRNFLDQCGLGWLK
jgi:S1-C subfamily serine protease